MKIALCGNPNVGKTTLYNRLTHSDAPVGNWHGVTVDVRTKSIGADMLLSDLPGAYSLTARTAEERITRDKILFGGYDVIAYVAEVNNLRRNLYMFMQILEAGKRAVLIVNMMDEAKGKVDLERLSKRLGVRVIGTSSKSENPKNKIIEAAIAAEKHQAVKPEYLKEPWLVSQANSIKTKAERAGLSPEFAALKIAERDAEIIRALGVDSERQCESGCSSCSDCATIDIDTPARLRYRYIDILLDGAVDKPKISERTRKIDRIVLGKLALPIFLAVMAAVFVITFEAGKPLSDLLVRLTEMISDSIRQVDMTEWVSSLLCDGIISGVGAALAFMPQVVILYLLTALLQDSGYMSRVAFVTDGFFKKFGLSGRAAFSVILGLGCSATAVLTTRGIAGDKARRRAAFATPFCPCSARLAVFTALSAYFGFTGLAVAAMYILGFAAALVVLKVMQALSKRTGGEDDCLIMEMPPYRVPQMKRVLGVVMRNVLSFIARIGSVILGVNVIMWVLCNFSIANGFTGGEQTSIMRTFSGVIAPIFAPLGFGNWRAVTALISGVAAKETVISVIATLGGMNAVFGSRLAALSFMIFTCLYVPCIATLSALAKESGLKSAFASAATHTMVAYAASLVFYRSALLLITDARVFAVVYSCLTALIILCVVYRFVRRHRVKRGAV
ncbi:MAG: ferrous iron transport protein B [Clostridiales bacterium]|nr:ferrous iron transport protein B [Clostridiales bacterium]